MDGTIVNSMLDLAACTNEAMGRHGFPPKPAEDYMKFAGNGIYVMIQRALAPARVSEAKLKEIRNDFFEIYKDKCTVNTTAYKGIPELVSSLKEKGIKVGCITNKVEAIALKIIYHFFGGMDVVYGQVDGVPNKPDPLLTLKALKELEIKPEECLFVGDSDVDMQTAGNSGCVGVGVLWGFRDEAELRANGAKFIVKEAEEILEIVDKYE